MLPITAVLEESLLWIPTLPVKPMAIRLLLQVLRQGLLMYRSRIQVCLVVLK